MTAEFQFSSLQGFVDFNHLVSGFDVLGMLADGDFYHPCPDPTQSALDSAISQPLPEELVVGEVKIAPQEFLHDLVSPQPVDSPHCQQMVHRAAGRFIPFSSYSFIAGNILWGLGAKETAFLEQAGCLHLPSRPALDGLVTQYFLYVHPTFPLINELEFWKQYKQTGSPPSTPDGISLFVFQAMLFLACPVSDVYEIPRTTGMAG